jgi:hypothetical protein
MALLEIGCRDGWLLPSVDVLASRARALGDALRNSDDPAALAFEGYTLVGACWQSVESTSRAAMDVYVMPAQRPRGLEEALRNALVSGESLRRHETY